MSKPTSKLVDLPNDAYFGKDITSEMIQLQVLPAPAVAESPGPLRTLFVSQLWTTPIDVNTQFTSIPLALAKIGSLTSNTPLATEPWTIIVYPGTYNDPIDMLSNVSIVGMNQNCVILGAEATLTWECGGTLNAGNTANREVVGFSNFTTLGHITLTRTNKTGGTTLTTIKNMNMSSGLKNFRIFGRTTVVPATDDRVEITSCKLDAASYLSKRYGYVRKTDTRCNFGSFSAGGNLPDELIGTVPGGSLYFAKNCQDYGGERIFLSTNAWYFSCITAATQYNATGGIYNNDDVPSIVSFDNCLFDIYTGSNTIAGNNPYSKYFVRNCTIQQNMIDGNLYSHAPTPCDVDRWEFEMQELDPLPPYGTLVDFNQPWIDPDYFVTMTAAEVTHTCPVVEEKEATYSVLSTNSTTQPWFVCATSRNSTSAPIPPF
jgi:hypothetical protein